MGEEGKHVEDLAVDREAVEGSEEEPGDELREALSGDALLLPQQGDRDGEGGAADLQVRSQHEGLSRQGQKRPELPAESLNKRDQILFKIHSVPRQETIWYAL